MDQPPVVRASMFEGLVAAILNRFLGEYVANLEHSQLNVGLLSGNVVLTDLKLRTAALDKFQLPIDVVHGYLGRLELHIPWSNLKSQPVRVNIENLYIVAVPGMEVPYDAEREAERTQRVKQDQLAAWELHNAAQFQGGEFSDLDKLASNASFTSKLLTKIVDNMQVTIRKIHVRFEQSGEETPFRVGILLNSLTMHSANEKFERAWSESDDVIFKVVGLSGLEVYWSSGSAVRIPKGSEDDDEATIFASRQEISECSVGDLELSEFVDCFEQYWELNQEMDSSISQSELVHPVCGSAHVTIYKRWRIHDAVVKQESKLPLAETLVDLIFDQFSVALKLKQYADMLWAISSLALGQRQIKYKRHRFVGMDSDGFSWWKFAMRCVLSDVRRQRQQRTWQWVLSKGRLRKEYLQLMRDRYVGSVQAKSDDDDESNARIVEIEQDFDYDQLVVFRRLARRMAQRKLSVMAEAAAAAAAAEKANEGLSVRLWKWLGYTSAETSVAASGSEKLLESAATTDEDWEELCRVIDYDAATAKEEEKQQSTASSSVAKFSLGFRLDQVSFSIIEQEQSSDDSVRHKQVGSLILHSLSGSVMRRLNSWRVQASLIDVELHQQLMDDAFQNVVRSMRQPTSNGDNVDSLLDVSFDQHSAVSGVDSELVVDVRPISVIYHPKAFGALVGLFVNERTRPLIDAVGSQAIAAHIKSTTMAGVRLALDSHRDMHLDVLFRQIVIFFPNEISLLGLNLQSLAINSFPVPDARLRRPMVDQSVESVESDAMIAGISDAIADATGSKQTRKPTARWETLLDELDEHGDELLDVLYEKYNITLQGGRVFVETDCDRFAKIVSAVNYGNGQQPHSSASASSVASEEEEDMARELISIKSCAKIVFGLCIVHAAAVRMPSIQLMAQLDGIEACLGVEDLKRIMDLVYAMVSHSPNTAVLASPMAAAIDRRLRQFVTRSSPIIGLSTTSSFLVDPQPSSQNSPVENESSTDGEEEFFDAPDETMQAQAMAMDLAGSISIVNGHLILLKDQQDADNDDDNEEDDLVLDARWRDLLMDLDIRDKEQTVQVSLEGINISSGYDQSRLLLDGGGNGDVESSEEEDKSKLVFRMVMADVPNVRIVTEFDGCTHMIDVALEHCRMKMDALYLVDVVEFVYCQLFPVLLPPWSSSHYSHKSDASVLDDKLDFCDSKASSSQSSRSHEKMAVNVQLKSVTAFVFETFSGIQMDPCRFPIQSCDVAVVLDGGDSSGILVTSSLLLDAVSFVSDTDGSSSETDIVLIEEAVALRILFETDNSVYDSMRPGSTVMQMRCMDPLKVHYQPDHLGALVRCIMIFTTIPERIFPDRLVSSNISVVEAEETASHGSVFFYKILLSDLTLQLKMMEDGQQISHWHVMDLLVENFFNSFRDQDVAIRAGLLEMSHRSHVYLHHNDLLMTITNSSLSGRVRNLADVTMEAFPATLQMRTTRDEYRLFFSSLGIITGGLGVISSAFSVCSNSRSERYSIEEWESVFGETPLSSSSSSDAAVDAVSTAVDVSTVSFRMRMGFKQASWQFLESSQADVMLTLNVSDALLIVTVDDSDGFLTRFETSHAEFVSSSSASSLGLSSATSAMQDQSLSRFVTLEDNGLFVLTYGTSSDGLISALGVSMNHALIRGDFCSAAFMQWFLSPQFRPNAALSENVDQQQLQFKVRVNLSECQVLIVDPLMRPMSVLIKEEMASSPTMTAKEQVEGLERGENVMVRLAFKSFDYDEIGSMSVDGLEGSVMLLLPLDSKEKSTTTTSMDWFRNWSFSLKNSWDRVGQSDDDDDVISTLVGQLSVSPLVITMTIRDLRLLQRILARIPEEFSKQQTAWRTENDEQRDVFNQRLQASCATRLGGVCDLFRLVIIDESYGFLVPLLDVSLKEISYDGSMQSLEEQVDTATIAVDHVMEILSQHSSMDGLNNDDQGSLLFSNQSAAFDNSSTPQTLRRLQAVLSADSFDMKSSAWEPIIEPWKFSITYGPNEELEPSAKLTMVLRSERSLELVVVHHTLKRLMNLSLDSKQKRVFHWRKPLEFHNHLDVTIVVSGWSSMKKSSDASGNSNQQSEGIVERKLEIPPNETRTFRMQDWWRQSFRTGSSSDDSFSSKKKDANTTTSGGGAKRNTQEHLISVGFASETFEVLNGLEIHRDGIHRLECRSYDASTPSRTIYMQVVMGGSGGAAAAGGGGGEVATRHVHFRERIILANETDQNFVLTMGVGNDHGRLLALNPRSVACVPKEYDASGSNSTGRSSSKSNSGFLSLSSLEHGPLSESIRFGSSQFLVSDSTQYNVLLWRRALGRGIADVTLCPPIRLESHVPMQMQVKIEQKGRAPVIRVIPASGSLQLHEIDVMDAFEISTSIAFYGLISMAAYRVSSLKKQQQQRNHRQSAGTSKMVALENEDGWRIALMMSQSMGDRGELVVTMSPEYLLLNQTEYQMQVQSIGTARKRTVTTGTAIVTISALDDILASSSSDGDDDRRHGDDSLVSGYSYTIFSHHPKEKVSDPVGGMDASASASGEKEPSSMTMGAVGPTATYAAQRVVFRFADSEWSEPVSLDVVGTNFHVDCKSMLTSRWYNMAGFVSQGEGVYGRTRIVKMSPRYVFVNDCACSLQVFDGVNSVFVGSKQRVFLHVDPLRMKSIRFCSGLRKQWSASFDLETAGHLYMRFYVHHEVESEDDVDGDVDGLSLISSPVKTSSISTAVVRKQPEEEYHSDEDEPAGLDLADLKLDEQQQSDVDTNDAEERSIRRQNISYHHRSMSSQTSVRSVESSFRHSLVRVDRDYVNPILYVRVTETAFWPFIIHNSSRLTVVVQQMNTSGMYVCEPMMKLNYTWDEPCLKDKRLLVTIGNERAFSVDISLIGKTYRIKTTSPSNILMDPQQHQQQSSNRLVILLTIVAHGPAVVVKFQEQSGSVFADSLLISDAASSTAESTNSSTNSNEDAGGVMGGADGRQVVPDCLHWVMRLMIPRVGISVIGPNLEEFLYVRMDQLDMRLAESTHLTSYGLTVKWMQIDNQVFDWTFPLLFYPTRLAYSTSSDTANSNSSKLPDARQQQQQPFLNVGLIQARNAAVDDNVAYFKYFAALVQEFSVEIGEELLQRIAAFVLLLNQNALAVKKQRSPIVSEKDLRCAQDDDLQLVVGDSSLMLFFEFFQLHPIKANLSFSRSHDEDYGAILRSDSGSFADTDDLHHFHHQSGAATSMYASAGGSGGNEEEEDLGALLSGMVDQMTNWIGPVSDAPLKLNALILENVFVRRNRLMQRVGEHYQNQALTQIYSVLMSVDLLGNPMGLVSSLGSGITDLFYEPYLGFVSDRPQDVGIGLARGGLSLVKKTVVGVGGSISKLTGTLAKGLSAATLDKSFQHERRVEKARNRPQHVGEGITSGMGQLFSGVKSGLAGVVNKPIEGARDEGVGGFFQGVGLGVVGLFTKPLVGVVDLTASVTEGIRNSADDNLRNIRQTRLPRLVPYDGIVDTFDVFKASGQNLMVQAIASGSSNSASDRRLHERYVVHVPVDVQTRMLIMSTSRLYLFDVERRSVQWTLSLDRLAAITATDEGVLISVSGDRPTTKLIPVSSDQRSLFVQAVRSFLNAR